MYFAVKWITRSRAEVDSPRPNRVNPRHPILEGVEARTQLPSGGPHGEESQKRRSRQDPGRKGRPSPRHPPRERREVFRRIPRPSTDLCKRTRCTESRSSRLWAAGLGMLALPTWNMPTANNRCKGAQQVLGAEVGEVSPGALEAPPAWGTARAAAGKPRAEGKGCPLPLRKNLGLKGWGVSERPPSPSPSGQAARISETPGPAAGPPLRRRTRADGRSVGRHPTWGWPSPGRPASPSGPLAPPAWSSSQQGPERPRPAVERLQPRARSCALSPPSALQSSFSDRKAVPGEGHQCPRTAPKKLPPAAWRAKNRKSRGAAEGLGGMNCSEGGQKTSKGSELGNRYWWEFTFWLKRPVTFIHPGHRIRYYLTCAKLNFSLWRYNDK